MQQPPVGPFEGAMFKARSPCEDPAPGSEYMTLLPFPRAARRVDSPRSEGRRSVEPMSEPTPEAMRREVLAAVEVVLSNATTTFAELLALLIESDSLDRTQLEGA